MEAITVSLDLAIGDPEKTIQVPASTSHSCAHCLEPGRMRCPYCDTSYCCRDCQVADHYLHRVLCGYLAADFAVKESDDQLRALVFPHGKKDPEFLWVIRTGEDSGLQVAMQHPSLDRVKPIRFDEDRYYNIDTGHGRNLILFTSSSEKDGDHLLNRCVMSVAGHPGQSWFWFGPIFAIASTKDENGVRLSDIDLNDFRRIVDFIRGEPRNPCILRQHLPFYAHPVVPALKLNDRFLRDMIAARFETEIPDVEDVIVPAKSGLTDTLPCAFPFILGLKWYIRAAHTCHASKAREEELVNYSDATAIVSPDAVPLIRWIHIDYEDGDFDAPIQARIMQTKICGPIIVMHASGAPIHWAHLFALREYMNVRQSDADTNISEVAFRKYWDTFKKDALRCGLPLEDVESPYDIQHRANAIPVIHPRSSDPDNPYRILVALSKLRRRYPWQQDYLGPPALTDSASDDSVGKENHQYGTA